MNFDPNKLFMVGLIVVIALILIVVCMQIYGMFAGPGSPGDKPLPPGVYMPAQDNTLIQDHEGSTGEIPVSQGVPYVKDGKEVPYTYTVPGRPGLWYQKFYDVKAGKPFARGKDGPESPYREQSN